MKFAGNMGNDLASYIGRIELLSFFGGYPLLYCLVWFLADEQEKAVGRGRCSLKRVAMLLPFAYALSGTLYLGLLLKESYPDYPPVRWSLLWSSSFLKVWGLLSVLFWIPALGKRTVVSLVHSLVFFGLLTKDLFGQLSSPGGKEMLRNDMIVYSGSLLLNAGTLAAVSIGYFILWGRRKVNSLPSEMPPRNN